jgi:hypothetical protein
VTDALRPFFKTTDMVELIARQSMFISMLLGDESCIRAKISGNHGSIWDSWPIAFSGYPRGPRVGCETGARSTQRLTTQLRLALEPGCLENPTATAREDPKSFPPLIWKTGGSVNSKPVIWKLQFPMTFARRDSAVEIRTCINFHSP